MDLTRIQILIMRGQGDLPLGGGVLKHNCMPSSIHIIFTKSSTHKPMALLRYGSMLCAIQVRSDFCTRSFGWA